MESTVIVLLGIIAAGAASAIAWLAVSVRRKGGDSGAEARLLQAQIEAMRTDLHNSLASNQKLVASQLAAVTEQVNGQLASVSLQLQSSAGHIGDRMDSSSRAVNDLRERLGSLSKATERIYEIGKDISGLQELLRAPKMRGAIGEFFLADLLAQCLPQSSFALQHSFKNGARVDAVVRLSDGMVPVDAKFPLENFKRALSEAGEEGRRGAKKRFKADCRRHIDAIASSYILPEEGTFGFALMYIPAENVYYETIIKDGDEGEGDALMDYAFSRRVIPVSPASFYAYLQTILLGLRGLEISSRAKEILASLDALRLDFDRVLAETDTLGRHITNAKAKHEELDRRLERFGARLGGLGASATPSKAGMAGAAPEAPEKDGPSSSAKGGA